MRARTSACDGGLAGADQRLAAVALGQHALLPHRRRLAQLARRRRPDAPGAGDGDAGEAVREVVEVVDDPGVAQQPRARARPSAPARGRGRPGARLPAARSRPAAARSGCVGRVEHQRAAAVGAGAVEQGGGGRPVVERPRRAGARRARRRPPARSPGRPRARRRARPRRPGRRPGCAGTGCTRRARRRRAPPRGGRPRPRARPRAAAPRTPSSRSRACSRAARRPLDGAPPAPGVAARAAASCCLELGQLARQLGLAVAVEPRQLLLELGDPRLGRSGSGRSVSAARRSAGQMRLGPRHALARASRAARTDRLGAVADALAGGLGQEASGARAPRGGRSGCARASSAASRRAATSSSARSSSWRSRAGLLGRGRCAWPWSARWIRRSSRTSSQRASSVWRSRRACSSAASAWRLSGRSRERASRSTSSARSRFSWVRASFSCARRRRLRCLPRPGGLLDQHAAGRAAWR